MDSLPHTPLFALASHLLNEETFLSQQYSPILLLPCIGLGAWLIFEVFLGLDLHG